MFREMLSVRQRWSHAPNVGVTEQFSSEVTALGIGMLDGSSVAVVGHADGPTLIDLATGTRRPTTVRCRVTAAWCPAPGPGSTDAVLGCEEGTVRELDLRHGIVGEPSQFHDGRVTAIVQTSHEGSFATSGVDGSLCFWNPADSQAQRLVNAHDRAVQSLAAGRVGEGRDVVVSGGADGRIRFWDPVDLSERRAPVDDGLASVNALVVVDHAGRPTLVAGGLNGCLVLRDLETGELVSGPHHINDGGLSSLAQIEFAGRRILLCGLASSNRLGPRAWDLDSGRLLPGVLPRTVGRDEALAVTEIDGRPVTVLAHGMGWSGKVTALDIDLQRFDAPPPGHMSDVLGVDTARVDGRDLVLTAGKDDTVRLTALDDGGAVDRLDLENEEPSAVTWCGRGDQLRALIGLADGSIEARRPTSAWARSTTVRLGRKIHRLGVVREGERELAVTASPGGELHRLDVTDPAHVMTHAFPEFGEDWLMGFDVSPSGIVAASRGKNVQLFRATDGDVVSRWRELTRVFALAHVVAEHRNRDERHELVAVAGADRIVRLRDQAGTETLPPLVGHTDSITALAGVNGTSLLLSASEDQTIRLWDVPYSTEVATFTLGWRPEKLLPLIRDARLWVVVAGAHLAALEFELPRR